MHRLMVTSEPTAGRTWDDAAGEADPDNFLLWRMRPGGSRPSRSATPCWPSPARSTGDGRAERPPADRRGGPRRAVAAGQRLAGLRRPRTAARRSVYVFVKRTLPLPELELLDAADTDEPCPRRAVTTTAPQALLLLNGAFWHEQAARFAARFRARPATIPPRRSIARFRLAFGRPPPTTSGTTPCVPRRPGGADRQTPRAPRRADPEREALRAFCLVMMNANEFVTVD